MQDETPHIGGDGRDESLRGDTTVTDNAHMVAVEEVIPGGVPLVNGDGSDSESSLRLTDVLTTVRGVPIRVSDVIDLLKVRKLFRAAIYDLIERRVVIQAAALHGIRPSAQEVHAARDRLRMMMGLGDPVALQNFLRQNGIQHRVWNEYVEAELLKGMLRDRIPAEAAVEAYWAANRERFTSRVLARIVFQKAVEAKTCLSELKRGDDFAACAARHSADASTRLSGGFVGEVRRGFLTPAVEREVFAAPEGGLVGPIQDNGFWVIYKICEIRGKDLSDGLRQRIRDQLFGEWLRDQVQTAPA